MTVSNTVDAAQVAHFNYVSFFMNSQEKFLFDVPGSKLGKAQLHTHSGLAWWGIVEFSPNPDTFRFRAQSGLFPGEHDSHYPSLYRAPSFESIGELSPSFCARFPSNRGCRRAGGAAP
jgi:hypothetical protein